MNRFSVWLDSSSVSQIKSLRDAIDNSMDATRIQIADPVDAALVAARLIREQIEIERRLREQHRLRRAALAECAMLVGPLLPRSGTYASNGASQLSHTGSRSRSQ